jgi:hypothetical protein
VSEQGPSRPLTDLGGIIVLRRCLLACALLLVVPAVASGHDPRQERPSRWIGTAGTNVPLVMSPNVRLVDTFPETQGISGEFARTGDFFYMSSLDSVSVFDTSDPLHPKLRGTLANLVFENEAMSYGGRRKADGSLERFVLVGNDLYNVTADETGGVQRDPVKFGDGLSTPIGGFCSAHWFDYHQSGIVAQGYYQQGPALHRHPQRARPQAVRVRDRRRDRGLGRLLGAAARQARGRPAQEDQHRLHHRPRPRARRLLGRRPGHRSRRDRRLTARRAAVAAAHRRAAPFLRGAAFRSPPFGVARAYPLG